jgi:hypothetical protein
LRFERVVFLPLGVLGTTDKWTVRFRQEHGEVPAQQAAVNVLLDLEGRVLSVQSTAFVGLELLSALPSVDASQAEQVARASFRTETGRVATRVTTPRLVWSAPLDAVGLPLVEQPRLAW